MSIICEEVFDEISHPAVDEIKDYALKIGIDPDSEPHLLPLATEALMKALPAGWKPCYDDKFKSYYYYNETTKKTQWEHPLDDKYRNLVKKVRAESQSLSLNEPNTAEDATYAKEDELKSYEEIVPNNDLNKLKPLILGPKKRDNNIRLSPLKVSPKHELIKLMKQQSEDIQFSGNNRFIKKFNSFDEDNISKDPNVFDRHPRALENNKMELKVTGGGTMFLKSNTSRKISDNSSAQKSEIIDIPKSILRDRAINIEHSKSMDFDNISLLMNNNDRSTDKDDEDKKSVRFNLDNNNITDDLGITFSEDNKSSSEEEDLNIICDNKLAMDVTKPPNNLKLIKVPPSSFIKPKLTVNTGSDSEEDTKSIDKLDLKALEAMLLQGEMISDSSPEDYNVITGDIKKKLEEKCEKKVADIKQKLWEEKNEELINFKVKLEESHRHELDRIKQEEKLKFEQDCKTELDIYKKELENRSKEERLIYDKKLLDLSQELQEKLNQEKETVLKDFDQKKDELERYYEEKLVDIEQELADKVEKQKENLIISRNAEMEQLKNEIQIEKQTLKQEHENELTELRNKHKIRVDSLKLKNCTDENKPLEKINYEKRLLEDKYRCLKDKYSRLKTEVKLSLEKRHHKKEQSNTNTTGSETEQSHSNNNNNNNNNKEKTQFFRTTPLNSPSKKLLVEKPPPTPAVNPSSSTKLTKMVQIQDLDTSISDNCYQSDGFVNHNNDSSDSTNVGKSKKKLFSRLKSSSASQRVTAVCPKTRKTHQQQIIRSCSPVENLRKQLQKLEDLEDQFPENSQSDTLYHLRYPFSDGEKFEGQSSELEFFRHRIHLERDSIKRAKESLRSQKTLFKQRQNESKLKHGSMARHTLQQLCHEEKELTDMEVNLHRTRSLLGEKVIRLKHLEESLHRANAQNETPNKFDDATLSDLSSHSASSGISSTEFLAITNNKTDFQEPTEIIQSLENLNSEIREIWDVLRTQQQQQQHSSASNNTHHQVSPSLVYPDFGWPILTGTTANLPSASSSILTLADRLHNYRQHVAIANAQSTVVNASHGATTTTLIERTRNLRHWLRQNGTDTANEANSSSQQANL